MCCDNEIAAVILPPLVGLWMIDVFKNSGEQGDLGGGRRGSLGGGKMRDLGEGRGNLGGKERGDLGGEIFLGYVFWRINFLMWSFLVVYCARYKKKRSKWYTSQNLYTYIQELCIYTCKIYAWFMWKQQRRRYEVGHSDILRQVCCTKFFSFAFW